MKKEQTPICPHCHSNLLCTLIGNCITDAYCSKCSYIPINQIQFITDEYRAITIHQPYAYLICAGIKDIENRKWQTKYRGRIYIHAGKTQYRNPWDVLNKEQNEFLMQNEVSIPGSELQYSAIIGHVDIVDCIINHPSIWAETTALYKNGMNPQKFTEMTGIKPTYNWVLSNPVLFDEPIENIKGVLSFWNCSNHVKNILI